MFQRPPLAAQGAPSCGADNVGGLSLSCWTYLKRTVRGLDACTSCRPPFPGVLTPITPAVGLAIAKRYPSRPGVRPYPTHRNPDPCSFSEHGNILYRDVSIMWGRRLEAWAARLAMEFPADRRLRSRCNVKYSNLSCPREAHARAGCLVYISFI